eukprot:6693267-Prymnesium_polylepis.1
MGSPSGCVAPAGAGIRRSPWSAQTQTCTAVSTARHDRWDRRQRSTLVAAPCTVPTSRSPGWLKSEKL